MRALENQEPPSPPDTQVFHAMPAGSDTALVAFTAKGGGQGVFHFFKTLQPLPQYTKLLVRDPKPHWYNDGLPGVGHTVEEIAARIEREVAKLDATRIITLGPSMGAYGAILFGCMLGADRVVAFCPQTLLDPNLRIAPPASVRLQAPDLVPIVRDSPDTKIDLVAGWDDHLDVFHAQRIDNFPWVRVFALRNAQHSFMEDLHRDGDLVPLIATLVEGGTPDLCDIAPRVDPDVAARIGDTAYAAHRGDWKTVAERIGPVAERYPEWAGPNFDLGKARAELGEWEQAELACVRAVRANPGWAGARELLVKALREQGQWGRAEQVTRDGRPS